MGRGKSLKKPKEKMTPEEYTKWYYDVIKNNAQGSFAKFGIELPDEFREVSPHEQELLDERVEALIYRLNKENKDEAEKVLEKAGFVSEDDWQDLQSGKLDDIGVKFKVFKGKNYDLEFVKRGYDSEFHIMLQYRALEPIPTVYDELVLLMNQFVPEYWKVGLSFASPVTPCHEQLRGEDMKVVSSYCIKFKNASRYTGATHILNRCLKNILANFVLPSHFG